MTYLIWVCCAPQKGKLDFTVLSSFSSTIYSSLSSTRPQISGQHSLSATNLESPSSTSANDDTYIWQGATINSLISKSMSIDMGTYVSNQTCGLFPNRQGVVFIQTQVISRQAESCFQIEIKLFPDRHQAASRQTGSCFKLDTMLKGNQTYNHMRYTSCSICACLSSSGLRSLAIFFLFPRGFVVDVGGLRGCPKLVVT